MRHTTREQDLEEVLFGSKDSEAELLNCNHEHFEKGRKLAAFLQMKLDISEQSRTAVFRRNRFM